MINVYSLIRNCGFRQVIHTPVIIILFFFPFYLEGQNVTTCPNSNFSLGNFTNWVGCWGSFNNPCLYPELDTNTIPPYPHNHAQCYQVPPNPQNLVHCPPLHSIIPGPGTLDPNTGDSLISVFPGEAYSARLGHNVGGTHGARLKYTVYVDNTSYLFIYRYAVVLQNPPHQFNQQPSFTVAVTDSTGAIIDSTCGYYYIYANDTNLTSTWHVHQEPTGKVIWKEWTTVGMSLQSWVGHHLTLVFTSRDCSQGGHFGYAYISAYCNYLQVTTAMCQGDSSATLTAPPGFTYLWSTSETTQSIVVPHPITGSTYDCILTAVNGCQVTISVTLTYTVIHANFTHGSGCFGYSIPFSDSSWISQNEVVNWKWDFGDGSPEVDGIPNLSHIYSIPGTYNVKLKSYSTEGCVDSITKQLLINPLPDLTNNPLIKRTCSRSGTNIQLTANLPGTLFTWTAMALTPNTTGFSDNISNPTTTLNQVLVNNGNQVDTVIYHITPHYTSCVGIPKDFKVAVMPLSHLTTTPLSKGICNGTSTNISLTSNTDSTKFIWTCISSSPNVTGYVNNTLIPDIVINQVLFNSGFTVETVTYSITSQRNGCSGDTSNYTVTVFPVPDVYFIPPGLSVCSGFTCNISNASHVAGTSFTWTATGSSPDVTGYSPGSGNLIQQILINASVDFQSVTYHVIPTANTCTGIQGNVTVTLYPLPPVTLTPCWDPKTTSDAKPIRLNGGTPSGGIYSGSGVSAGFFYPDIAGAGTKTITYSYTNIYGCSANKNQTLIVSNPALFTCGNMLTDVRDNIQYATVTIGSQCWLAENLNWGVTIGSAQMQRDNCVSEKYCYNDNPANCTSWGGLYQWDEVMRYESSGNVQGFCPPGWHIPDENDWVVLFTYYISNGYAGSPLKYDGFSGFNSLLSGIRFNNDAWRFNNFSIFYWTSTAHGSRKAWAHAMNAYNPSVSLYPSYRNNAFPVRCLKD
jgi:uncharacterized protein (TIGR02145 family)